MQRKSSFKKTVGCRAFHHEGETYESVISAHVAGGTVYEIEFSWTKIPPKPLSKLSGQQEWARQCFATIDAEFGAGSVGRAEIRSTILGAGSATATESAAWRASQN